MEHIMLVLFCMALVHGLQKQWVINGLLRIRWQANPEQV